MEFTSADPVFGLSPWNWPLTTPTVLLDVLSAFGDLLLSAVPHKEAKKPAV
jgi:hypothetical protein